MSMEDIAKRVPANATAGKVVSRPSDQFKYHFENKTGTIVSEIPLPVRQPTEHELELSQFTDLTGTRIDRLIVIGKSEKKRAWVVRCDCGRYTTRRTAAIKRALSNPNGADIHACEECQDLQYLKNRDAFNRSGKYAK